MEDEEIQVVFIGEINTGKTSIINRLIYNKFNSDIQSTLGQNRTTYKSEQITYIIADFSGKHEFSSLLKIFLKRAKVCILVYSITDRNSFEALKNYWYEEVHNLIKYPCIVIFKYFSILCCWK